MQKINNKKIINLGLFAFLFASSINAAAPKVTTDETVYQTLDYYGQETMTTIVKTVSLNGNSEFIDYGNYEQIKNLSTQDQPQINQDAITWKLNSDGKIELPKHFYYEVTPKKIDLPWSVDISYQLNGTPIKAQDLAGKSGLVTIDASVKPNLTIDPYYRNNFILLAGTLVDTKKNYSFNAPGSQFQTFGNYQAAFFMATPKQEKTFHFEIGSDSFENDGLIFTMIPATAEQLDDLAEVREHKDNIENLGKSSNAILDDILSTMGNMTGGLNTTLAGLSKLDSARQEINDTDLHLDSIRHSMSSLETQLKDFSNSTNDISLEESSKKIGTNLYPKISGDPALLKTMQDVGEDAKKFDKTLSEGAKTSNDTATMLKDSQELIKSIDSLLDESGDNLDEGTALVLRGMIATLNDINIILKKTDNLYKNKEIIADIVADEWQRLDDELGLLDIDTKAKKISFTSPKNDSPRSLQIILRSQEISLEDEIVVNSEDKKTSEQILDRVKMIFNKIGETFISWGQKL